MNMHLLRADCTGIPLPIVRLNRLTIVAGVVLAALLQQPWITTVLFVVIGSAALVGPRGSAIYQIGARVYPAAPGIETEDPRLMRFNNVLATILLGSAQL